MSSIPTTFLTPLDNDASTVHESSIAEGMEATDTFLSYVPEGGVEVLWPGIAFDDTTTARLEALVRQEILPSGRFSQEAVTLVLWRLERARAAAAELRLAEEKAARIHAGFVEHVRENAELLDSQVERMQSELAKLDDEIPCLADEFHGAMAEAGLSVDAEVEISPAAVEDAIADSAPDEEALAGQYGIVPVEYKNPGSLGTIVSRFFLDVFAPATFGFLVALCLGTLIGIVSLTDIGRPEKTGMLLAAWGLGTVLVLVLGESIVNATKSLARKQENDLAGDLESDKVPRLRGKWVLGGLFAVVAAAIGAELCVEAVGLMEIHHQRVLSMQRVNGATNLDTSVQQLPMALFILIGTVISVSYVLMKFSSTWNKAEEAQRNAWLLNKTQQWIENRRRQADVQAAIRAAGRLEAKARRRSTVESGVRAIEARREEVSKLKTDEDLRQFVTAKWSAAIGEATKAQEAFDALVAAGPTQAPERYAHAL